MTTSTPVLPDLTGQNTLGWPMEIRALMASLQTQVYVPNNRRRSVRRTYQVQAILWFKDAGNSPRHTTIYTRDATEKAVAFLAQQPFKIGQSTILEIPSDDGAQRFAGHIRRCRQFRDGWFECLIMFPNGKAK
jgi:hypothetical protein